MRVCGVMHVYTMGDVSTQPAKAVAKHTSTSSPTPPTRRLEKHEHTHTHTHTHTHLHSAHGRVPEVAVQNGRRQHRAGKGGGEALLHELAQERGDHELVLGADEAVVQDAQALVAPQAQELGRRAAVMYVCMYVCVCV